MTWQVLQKDSQEEQPVILPPEWREMPTFLGVYQRQDGLRVISSVILDPDQDNQRWLHVSMSRPTTMPSYEDLQTVKDLFIGQTRKAVQIFPPKAQHVNVHPNCLHLWCCLDRDLLPDFRQDGQI